MNQINITGRGIKLTEPLKNYINKKISKLNKLFNKSISVYCEIKETKTRIGVNRLFTVEVSISLPRAYIKVQKEGYDVYQLIDEIEPVLQRRVKKYWDKLREKNNKQKLAFAV
jgi:ribosomal subunit interface protein